MKYSLYIAALAGLMAGCTNADMAQISAFGSPGHITCYSGGKVILDAESSGVIHTEKGSDGWYFADKATGKLVRVSGACVVRANS